MKKNQNNKNNKYKNMKLEIFQKSTFIATKFIYLIIKYIFENWENKIIILEERSVSSGPLFFIKNIYFF